MKKTPRANRLHIAVYGRRNVGKSSLINSLTNQDLALVSDVAGTTADPVYKSMELLPFGPVVMIDTAGIDDKGELGELRIKKTKEVMRRTDLALLVFDYKKGITKYEKKLLKMMEEKKIPIIPVINKKDLIKNDKIFAKKIDKLKKKIDELKYNKYDNSKILACQTIAVSARTGEKITELKEKIIDNAPADYEKNTIIGDLHSRGEVVVLVTPIDSSAPKGRLILPQVQTIRDILDHNGITLVTKETELKETLAKLKEPPALVVTDSQVFAEVEKVIPDHILLTGFSVLFARYKGDLKTYLKGVKRLNELKAGSKVLVAEACTHHRQEEDIGTVKIPNWIREKIDNNIEFDHVSGREYPENLSDYDLILHCGACMLNRKEMISRLREAENLDVPVINYGMAIAQLHGILDRALEPFPIMQEEVKYAKITN